MRLKTSMATGLVLLATLGAAQAEETLDAIRVKGFVQCGVSQGLPGFSNPDDQGNWSGLDVDYCRAIAVAVFNDRDAAKFTPTSAEVRFTALNSGEVDILTRNTSWTMSHDTDFGEFVGVNFYDGQGFMVPAKLDVSSATELDGETICINSGTTTELNVADYFDARGMKYSEVAFEKADDVVAAYDAGRCNVYSTDRSGLAAQRSKLSNPDAHVVLPEIISKEPLGPLVRHGDSQWADIARWAHACMVNAEELGVSSANIGDMKDSDDPDIKRLLGIEGDLGARLELDNAFCANIIEKVGNYSEVYDANVGLDTKLGLERGLNALWVDGGVMYVPLMR